MFALRGPSTHTAHSNNFLGFQVIPSYLHNAFLAFTLFPAFITNMDLLSFVEDALVAYILETFDSSAYETFTCMGKVLGSLEPDWEEETKDELWRRILERIDGRIVLQRIAECVPEESSDEETNE